METGRTCCVDEVTIRQRIGALEDSLEFRVQLQGVVSRLIRTIH